MTTLHVTDENTGRIVAVDIDTPTGDLYIRDYDGNLIQLDLSNPVGTGTVVHDSSSNRNDGTITGATWEAD